MVEYYFQTPVVYEVEVLFTTYSFKFNSLQFSNISKPITQIFFQRFTSISSYPALSYIQLNTRYCAQMQIPNLCLQTDCQKLFFSTLTQKPLGQDCVVAETIDENAEFVYLVLEQNNNPNFYRHFGGFTLEVYQFSYSELMSWSQNAFNYLRNLQLVNTVLEKQFMETNVFYEFFKGYVMELQMKAVNDESMIDKKIEEVRKLSTPKKQVTKVPVKIDLPNTECLLCCNYPKNIVFLPCGHVVACKICTTEQLDIVLGKIINQRRSPRSCPICKQAIKEAREVFI